MNAPYDKKLNNVKAEKPRPLNESSKPEKISILHEEGVSIEGRSFLDEIEKKQRQALQK